MDILFHTKRLFISTAKERDIPLIMALENHEDNKDFVWQGTYQEHLDEIYSDNQLLLTFRKKEDDILVGYALCRINTSSDVFELRRLVIRKKHYGYGKESLLGILKYSFEKLSTNRFWLDVYPSNTIGIHLYESIGMHLDGVLRQSYKDHRGYLDQMIFSMLREEYDKK